MKQTFTILISLALTILLVGCGTPETNEPPQLSLESSTQIISQSTCTDNIFDDAINSDTSTEENHSSEEYEFNYITDSHTNSQTNAQNTIASDGKQVDTATQDSEATSNTTPKTASATTDTKTDKEEAKSEPISKTDPGLYLSGSNYSILLKSWDDLKKEGIIDVYRSGQYETVTWSATDIRGDLLLYEKVTKIEANAFENRDGLTGIKCSKHLSSIDKYAFQGCDGLKEVILSEKLSTINESAFQDCSNLEEIVFAEKLATIGDYAFRGCVKLSEVSLVNNLKTIGFGAFMGCANLTKVYIPQSVTQIRKDAFEKCNNLCVINVSDANTVYQGTGNCLVEKESKTLIIGCKGSVIPADGSVTKIGNGAFSYCASLERITIPDSVTRIGYGAFYLCEGLTNITIGKGLADIEEMSFGCCNNLEKITVDAENKVYHSENNCLIDTANKTLILGCKNSIIPNDGSVTAIGNNAFADCENLTSIIPDSVIEFEPCPDFGD